MAGHTPQPEQGNPSFFKQLWSVGSNLLIMYLVFQMVFGGGSTKKDHAIDASTGEKVVIPPLFPIVKVGSRLELNLFVSEDSTFYSYNQDPLWSQSVLYSSEVDHSDPFEISFPVDEHLLNNGSLFAHIFFNLPGHSFNPLSEDYNDQATFSLTHPLVQYHKRPKINAETNLLTGTVTNNEQVLASKDDEIVSFFVPSLDISLVQDNARYARSQIPAQFKNMLQRNEEDTGYFPMIYPNEFWLYQSSLVQINETVPSLNLSISYSCIPMWKFTLMVQMEESFSMQQNMGSMAEGEHDSFKKMLADTNPYLLALTFAVSMLHSVFDFLAFKNDIQFWRQRDNAEGLSARAIVVSVFCQIVVLLYLFDNDTSALILISSAIGLLIEIWKLRKAVYTTVQFFGPIPYPSFQAKNKNVSKTDEYDKTAMRYLSYALYPLLVAYATYSLLYDTHKSWYSFILNTLVGCVYTFGFIMMCPQLYINYKLKSVAHLPWRMLAYKSLNTFIDDLFSFIIEMPTLHRLSCFRDDIVFFVYLYQRWAYRTDKTRVNEFGVTFEKPEGDDAALFEPVGVKKEGKEGEKKGEEKEEGEKEAVAAVQEKETNDVRKRFATSEVFQVD